MTRTKRLALVLWSPIYVRSWIQTGILKEMHTDFDITLVGPDEGWFEDICKSEGLEGIKLDLSSKVADHLLSRAEWARKIEYSSSFRYYNQEVFLGQKLWFPKGRHPLLVRVAALFSGLSVFLSTLLMKPHFIFLRFSIARQLLTTWIKATTHSTNRFREHLNRLETFSFTIFASHAEEPGISSLQRAMRQRGLKFGIVLDNWDNLSSKSVLDSQPNFVTVMGETSLPLAHRIHQLPENSVHPIGLPRFEPYRGINTGSSKTPKVLSKRPRILYVGFSVPHDEESTISNLVNELQKLNLEHELRYRPHPAGPKRHLELLPESVKLSQFHDEARVRMGGLPSLNDEYFDDLSWAEIVVGPPTTMLLESLLSQKLVIVDAIDDGVNRTSAGHLLHRYEHMKQLLNLDSLQVCTSAEEIADSILSSISGRVMGLDQQVLRRFISSDGDSFAQRLSQLVIQECNQGED